MMLIPLSLLIMAAELPPAASPSKPAVQATPITDAMRARYWQAVSEQTAAQAVLQQSIYEMREACSKKGELLTQRQDNKQPDCAAPEASVPPAGTNGSGSKDVQAAPTVKK